MRSDPRMIALTVEFYSKFDFQRENHQLSGKNQEQILGIVGITKVIQKIWNGRCIAKVKVCFIGVQWIANVQGRVVR